MEGVEEVRRQRNKRLLWRAKIGGKVKEWEAEITDQVPDQKIAWRSIDGSPNAGAITFEALEADRTRVDAAIEYEPEGLLEKTGDALGIPCRAHRRRSQTISEFIESRERETGSFGEVGWVSEIPILRMFYQPQVLAWRTYQSNPRTVETKVRPNKRSQARRELLGKHD